MSNRPLLFNIFIFLIFLVIPTSLFITVYQDTSYLLNEQASFIFETTAYSKTIIKFIIGIYSAITAWMLVKKYKKAYIHSIILIFIILLSPFLIEIPFFVLEFWLDSPPHAIKDVVKYIPFTLLFFLIYFPYLIFSKWVSCEYKGK